MNEIVIFEGNSGKVEVRLEGETFWVTQSQMADLFATTTDNIALHLKNIFKDNELEENATTEEFSVVHRLPREVAPTMRNCGCVILRRFKILTQGGL